MSIIKERIERALRSPLIILSASADAKSERMAYINYARLNGMKGMLTVLYRQMSNRIIIGEKDFNLQTYITSYDTCSQDELDIAWANRKREIPKVENTIQKEMEQASEKVERQDKQLTDRSQDALASLGFKKPS